MNKIKFIIILLFAVANVNANDQKAFQIMKKSIDLDDGDKSIADMEMLLIDKNNNTRSRSLRVYAMDNGADRYAAMYFLAPADVKNSALLTYDYKDPKKDDDQWLYLPALKQTKRITSKSRSGSFMGSDFSFADLTKRKLDDYTFKYLKEDVVDNVKVWIIESTPKSQSIEEETGYKKSILIIRQDNFFIIRAVNFELKGNVKYMDVKDLQKIDGVLVPIEIHMNVKQNDKDIHKTILKMSNVKFNQKLDKNYFTVRQIEKGL